MEPQTKYHFWLGNLTGYVFSAKKECPVLNPPDRLKYLGYTYDVGWPKKMNTGRLLQKPDKKKLKLQRQKYNAKTKLP